MKEMEIKIVHDCEAFQPISSEDEISRFPYFLRNCKDIFEKLNKLDLPSGNSKSCVFLGESDHINQIESVCRVAACR